MFFDTHERVSFLFFQINLAILRKENKNNTSRILAWSCCLFYFQGEPEPI